MPDGTPVPQENEVQPLGDELDALLAALRRSNVQIGPREHVAAHTVAAELVARGRVRQIGDLRMALRPLLARTALEREAFDVVFDAHAPDTRRPEPEKPERTQATPSRPWWQYAVAALTVIAVGAVAWHNVAPRQKQPPNADFTTITPNPKGEWGTAAGQAPVEKPPETPSALLNRIADASKDYDGAPTLEELSRKLVLLRDAYQDTNDEMSNLLSAIVTNLKALAEAPDNPNLGAALNNSAVLYQAMGRYADAEPMFRRALAVNERVLGTEHPIVGQSLYNLAALYQAMGRYAEAEEIFRRALLVNEKALGTNHPTIGKSLQNLAEVAQALGRIAEADALRKRAIAIRERTLGVNQTAGGEARENLMGSQQEIDAAAQIRRQIEDSLNFKRQQSLRIGWPAEGYAIKLHEWTGLPLSVPIAVYGKDGKVGTTWARLALALGRIEQPGREPPYASLLDAAKANLDGRSESQTPVAYRLASRLRGWFPDGTPTTKADLIKAVQAGAEKADPPLGGPAGTPLAVDPFHVMRALAISEGIRLPPDFYKDAPWHPQRVGFEASYAPRWAPLIAFLFPVAFALFWLANSLALRKAYLRRRPPELPPLHMNIVSQIGRRLATGRGQFRRIAQRLQVRTPETSDRISIPATIAATLASGGRFTPAYAQLYRTPEYLVLIERRTVGDQETEHLRNLIKRISDVVPVTIYTFQGDPAMLEPERAVGRPVLIEQVVAAHADHRLVILGSGEGLLDSVTLHPRPAAQRLLHFRHRVLLTPVPLAEWGREEFALAQELALPIGRATPEGMERLAELLGLDGNEDGNLIEPRGDGLARALPEMLRVHPDRFFYSAPPSDIEVPQLIRELRNFLDAPGFEWLCALAVYPAVQWDLTLYLGVTLADENGRKPEEHPLYSEQRIAALTHLPWLREGNMPAWLRRALIQELGKAGRADEVREALKSLIEDAKKQGERRNEDDVILRIAREQPKEGFDPERLYDDEVLLDFMARGRVEDFALPRRTWLEAILPRGLLDRIGIPGLVAGALALVYAAVAWWVTPKMDGVPWGLSGETPGALVTGAWLPLTVLCAGAVVALTLINPSGTASLARSLLIRCAAPALAFAIFMLALGMMPQILQQPPGVTEAMLFSLAAVCVLLSHRISAWLWITEPTSEQFDPWFVGKLLLLTLALPIMGWVAYEIVDPILAMSARRFPVPNSWFLSFSAFAFASLILFGAGWLLSRQPEASSSIRPARLLRDWAWLGGWARIAVTLALIVPAVFVAHHVSITSSALERAAPGSVVVAETADGRFLAIGGADGRVQVYDTRTSSAMRARTIDTGLGPISSLSIVARNPSFPEGSLIVAAGGANGRFAVRYVSDGSMPSQLFWAEQSSIQSLGQAPLVALGRDGRLLVAIEDLEMPARLLGGPGLDQQLPLDGRGSVTALAALDGERFAVATMDGTISVVALSATGTPALQPDVGAPLRLSDSRARRLMFDVGQQRLTAWGDDGTIIAATLEPDGALRLAGRGDRRAALGAAVPWNRERLACVDGVLVRVNQSPIDSNRVKAGADIDIESILGEQRCVKPGDVLRECSTCPEMVVVPAGRFTMGSPATEQGRVSDEGPQREVTIRQPFAVGKFEVTFEEWNACVADGGCKHRPADQSVDRDRRAVINVSWPVINVSWDDAKEYVAWLSRRTGATYRLLTEAEWEYAARAGTTTPYFWGATVGKGNANCYDCGSEWDGKRTAPVGSFKANAFGLYDMHGNVWEWVEDCYVDKYDGAPTDGSARTGDGIAKGCGSRVLRGGSWRDSPRELRAALRLGARSGRYDGFSFGFRLARTLIPSP